MRRPTVMISWAHVDRGWTARQIADWRSTVLAFATALLDSGVDAELDLWHYARTDVDWTRWGPRQVMTCDHTLIVITEAWRDRWLGDNDPRVGAGVAVEADTIKGIFRQDQAEFQRKHVVVLLPGVREATIPPDLQRLVRVRVDEFTGAGLEPLVRMLTRQAAYPKPSIGRAPVLPPLTDVKARPTGAARTSRRLRWTGAGAALAASAACVVLGTHELREWAMAADTAAITTTTPAPAPTLTTTSSPAPTPTAPTSAVAALPSDTAGHARPGAGSTAPQSVVPPPTQSAPGEWFALADHAPARAGDGHKIVERVGIGSQVYARSIRGDLWSTAEQVRNLQDWAVAGRCTRLTAWVGKAVDSLSPTGAGRFVVTADGRGLASVEVAMGEPQLVDVDISGAVRLMLSDLRGRNDADNAWGEPRVLCTAPPGPAR